MIKFTELKSCTNIRADKVCLSLINHQVIDRGEIRHRQMSIAPQMGVKYATNRSQVCFT